MDATPNLGLPYIMAAQAQKHVTHNEAIRALDAIVQLAVLDRDLSTPPGTPVDGDRYIIAASPSGDWSGHPGEIAAFQDNAWMFFMPREGWIAWVADEDAAVVWDSAAWIALASGGGGSGSLSTLGINATADTTNRLALSSAASLLNHEGYGHQVKVNKNTAGDTASLLFQTAFSGRAEMGTAGDDDFHFKVSADGAAWHEAIVIDRATGSVALPSTAPGALAAPNILLNGDFQINQRAFAGGALSAGVYGHDRWKADTGGADYSVSGYTVTLSSGTIQQVVEPGCWGYQSLASTAITVSVDTPSADLAVTVGSGSGTLPAGSGRRSVTITTGAGDTGNIAIKIAKASGGSVTFGRVKAEVGAAATAWSRRPSALERQLCQTYYRRLKPGGAASPLGAVGVSASTTLAVQYVTFTPEMRAAPSFSYSALGDLEVTGPTGSALTPTAIALFTASTMAAELRWTVASGLNQGDAVRLRTSVSSGASGWIAFDAEL